MIPIRDDLIFRQRAILTLTLVGLIAVLYFWDREGRIWGASIAFADLAMRPGQITDVLRGQGDSVDLSRLFTSIFLHANLPHMVTNVVFLFAFGPSVEAALGGVRFALFYLFWGVVAFLAQIQAAPESMVPVLGAGRLAQMGSLARSARAAGVAPEALEGAAKVDALRRAQAAAGRYAAPFPVRHGGRQGPASTGALLMVHAA
jgi:hypothetical protein